MTREQIAREYFKMAEKIRGEKQLNKKMELNTKIHQFVKEYNLLVETNEPVVKLFICGQKIATIFKQYSSRKINLTYKELKKRRLLVMKGA